MSCSTPRLVRGLVCAVLGALLCTACATRQTAGSLPPLGDWQIRRQALGQLEDWGFSGRIAVRDADDGFNGSLHWQQRRDYFDVRVAGPLGAGKMRISGDSRQVRVADSDGRAVELSDAENDLQRLYGWRIPVASLRYWALGIPDPRLPSNAEVDAEGTLRGLQQAGWHVRIDQYRDAAGQPMPRRLTAERDGARVRLVIDRWTFY